MCDCKLCYYKSKLDRDLYNIIIYTIMYLWVKKLIYIILLYQNSIRDRESPHYLRYINVSIEVMLKSSLLLKWWRRKANTTQGCQYKSQKDSFQDRAGISEPEHLAGIVPKIG